MGRFDDSSFFLEALFSAETELDCAADGAGKSIDLMLTSTETLLFSVQVN